MYFILKCLVHANIFFFDVLFCFCFWNTVGTWREWFRRANPSSVHWIVLSDSRCWGAVPWRMWRPNQSDWQVDLKRGFLMHVNCILIMPLLFLIWFPNSYVCSVLVLCSEYQVKRLPLGMRCAKVNSCPEKQSPDSACSMEYSSSRLSSPEHPGEGIKNQTKNMVIKLVSYSSVEYKKIFWEMSRVSSFI